MQEVRTSQFLTLNILENGDLETWAAGVPSGWTAVLSAGNSITQETGAGYVYSGASACKVLHPNTGDCYIKRGTSQVLEPGGWYLAKVAMARGIGESSYAPGTAVRLRLVNVTKNTSYNGATAAWASGVTQQVANTVGTKYVLSRVWVKVPGEYSISDVYEIRAGFLSSSGTGITGWIDAVSLTGPFPQPSHKLAKVQVTTNRQPTVRQYQVSLVDPWGRTWDVTERLELDGLGTLTEQGEESLLQLVHGDLTLTLLDRDGFLEDLLATAQPTDRWQVIISRETQRRRTRWERLFAGVLDLPWSAKRNPGDGTFTLRAFTYSKDLEAATAEGVCRTFPALLGTVSSGGTAVTVSPDTTGLMRGDSFTLDDGVNRQDFQVEYIISTSQVRTSDTASSSFSSAGMTVRTPWYRYKTPAELAALLLAAAAPERSSVDLDGLVSDYPISSPVNASGTPLSGKPKSVTVDGSAVTATWTAAAYSKRTQATSPTSGFADGATSNVMQGDWTPYQDAAPGAVLSHSAGTVDAGEFAWDYVNSRRYEIQEIVSGGPTYSLNLYQNGVLLVTLESSGTGNHSHWRCEYDPIQNRVWYSFTNSGGVSTLKYYNVVGGTKATVSGGSNPVWPRFCGQYGGGVMLTVDETTRTLRVYTTATTPALLASVALPASVGRSLLWTARYLDGFLCWLSRGQTGTGTYLTVLDTEDWSVVAVYPLSTSILGASASLQAAITGTAGFLTRFTPAGGTTCLVGWAGEEWVVIGRSFLGVISYADFAGASVAKGLKDLATACLAMLVVDHEGTVSLTQRLTLEDQTPKLDLGEPLRGASRSTIWDHYRESVAITGRTDSGGDFEVVAGETGRSAKRLSVSLDLVTSPGAAYAVAAALAAYATAKREQVDGSWREGRELVRAMDVVTWDGKTWLVSSVQSSVGKAEQRLRLFEITG